MFDHELDGFKRGIHLVQFALDRYGYVRDPRESSRACHVLRHAASNDKIVVRKDADDHWTYFSVRDDRDSGTIIDFLQARGARSLRDVREELRLYLGTPQPEMVFPSAPARGSSGDVRPAAEAFAGATSSDSSLYLNERGIRPETLRDARFAGTWRIGPRENVFFLHRDDAGAATGFEIKNRGFNGFATGGRKTAWQSVQEPRDSILVITESAIDALSYHQLHPERGHASRYLSTAGAPSASQIELIDRMLGRLRSGSMVVAAVDSDHAGEKLAQRLEDLTRRSVALTFHRHAPAAGKDWNDVLQRVEEGYIRSLPARRASRERSGPER